MLCFPKMGHKQLIILTGIASKHDLNDLTQATRLLGCTDLSQSAQWDSATINQLLFQELGHTSDMIGPLSEGWRDTPAAERTEKRISRLLSFATSSQDHIFFIGDPFISPVLPLWLDMAQKAGLAPVVISLVTHPMKAALELKKEEGLSHEQTHIFWFLHLRETIRHTEKRPFTLIRPDQLRSDPVSTLQRIGRLLQLSWPRSPNHMADSLLTLFHPVSTHSHAGTLSLENEKKFTVYETCYEAVRQFQTIQWMEQSNRYPAAEDGSVKHHQPVRDLASTLSDLIDDGIMDSLLRLIAGYERQKRSENLPALCPTPRPNMTGLTARLIIPLSSQRKEIIKSFSLNGNQWKLIEAEIPSPTILAEKKITLQPLNTNGLASIRSMVLMNQVTQEVICDFMKGETFDALTVQGTGVRVPGNGDDPLTILCTGDCAEVVLPKINIEEDVPLKIQVWIKARQDQSYIHCFFSKYSRKINGALFLERLKKKHRDSRCRVAVEKNGISIKRIVVAGMRHSGSTALFNIIRLTLLKADIDVISFYSEHKSSLPDEDKSNRVFLIKTHEFRDDIACSNDLIMTTRRDLRNTVASAVRRGFSLVERIGNPVEYAKYNRTLHDVWLPLSDYVFIYENFIKDPIVTIKEVIELVDIKNIDANEIHEELLALPLDQYDITLLSKSHITDPQQKLSFNDTLDLKTIKKINSDHALWLDNYGYNI